MSDSSDVEIIDVSVKLNNSDNKARDDVDYSNSSDDGEEDPQVSGRKAIKQARSELEKERRSHLSMLFDFLQHIIVNGQNAEREPWKRAKVVSKALKVCQDLVAEEDKLKLELEILLQENWRLRKRLTRMSNRTKKKSGCSTLTRKVSSLTLSAPKLKVLEVNKMPVDDSPFKIETQAENPIKPTPEVKSEKKTDLPKHPKRRYKKRSGLSEEEKEFYVLKEKIEDLLCEVDTLWNEVKDEEETENKEILGLVNSIDKGNIKSESSDKVTKKAKTFEPTAENAETANVLRSANDCGSVLSSSPTKNTERVNLISVTDITKLMAPHLVQKQNANRYNLNADDSSDDECPRLVIDEGDSPRNSDQEVSVIELSEAVDTLCKNIIGGSENASNKESHLINVDNSCTQKISSIASDGSQSDSSVILVD